MLLNVWNGFLEFKILYFLFFSLEPSDESQQFEDEGDSWATPRRQGNIASVDEPMPMHNGAQVQFDPPKVPVVFVLGMSINSIKKYFQLRFVNSSDF